MTLSGEHQKPMKKSVTRIQLPAIASRSSETKTTEGFSHAILRSNVSSISPRDLRFDYTSNAVKCQNALRPLKSTFSRSDVHH
jgi:hypothetical protein